MKQKKKWWLIDLVALVFIIIFFSVIIGKCEVPDDQEFRVRAVSCEGDTTTSNSIILNKPLIFIYDPSGRLLRTEKDSARLEPGFYILKYKGKHGKIIIQ